MHDSEVVTLRTKKNERDKENLFQASFSDTSFSSVGVWEEFNLFSLFACHSFSILWVSISYRNCLIMMVLGLFHLLLSLTLDIELCSYSNTHCSSKDT